MHVWRVARTAWKIRFRLTCAEKKSKWKRRSAARMQSESDLGQRNSISLCVVSFNLCQSIYSFDVFAARVCSPLHRAAQFLCVNKIRMDISQINIWD